jgi:hypothetical protein
MLGFLIDNIFVVFGNTIFQQTVGIPMGTNCVPLLADLFLYSYEAEFIQKLLHEKNKPLAVAFNSTFIYIDDVLSINNDQFHSYVYSIYPNELEIQDTTESYTSALYLDVLINIDADGKLATQLYDKRYDFSFTIANFPYICSNIPLSPAYGVYISQLIPYARACSEADSKGMLGFLVDNIYVVFGDQVFQQSVGIPMGTNCAPLLADLFLYSYEAEFVQKLLQDIEDNNKKLAVSFNHTFRYIDDVLSINNHNFHIYVHLIYPDELEIKDTTESVRCASYLDILFNIDSNGRLTTSLYD